MSYAITQKKRLAIARDYHFSSMSNEEIMKKHKVQGIVDIASKHPREAIYRPKPKLLLKIDPEHYHLAIRVLQAEGIFPDEVTDEFELLEFHESKISPENNEFIDNFS